MSSTGDNSNLLVLDHCWLIHVLLGTGPTVAWLYAVNVWIMYSMAHECTWGSKLHKIMGRTSLVGASFAISMGLCGRRSSSDPWVVGTTILPLTVASVVVSVMLCRWTRFYDVVGVTKAPYYGPHHLQGKNVLITGANSGIGKETCQQLAAMGATVYLACRSTSRAQEAVNDILKQQQQLRHNNSIEASQLKIVAMDLGDLQSVRDAVLRDDGPLKDVPKIDILVNNAGLMMGTRTMSKDGMELMMQANHLGHYLLTRLLLPKLSDDARIINVTSSTYQLVQDSGFDFDDIMCSKTRKYTLFGQYAQTKLANILFTKELAKRYPHWKVYAVHPGLVRTNVTSNMPWILQTLNAMFAWFVASMQKTPPQGAYSNVWCASAPLSHPATPFPSTTNDRPLPPSGSYIVNCQAQAVTNAGNSANDAERLWNVSEQLVGLTTGMKERTCGPNT